MLKAMLLGGAFAAGAAVIVTAAVAERSDGIAFIFTEAKRYDARAWMDGRDRFPAGAQLRYAKGDTLRPVVAGFYASADASISFDAERVIFSGKRTARSPWQIWELSLTRGTPRQISSGDSDCMRPLYLPEDRIVYTRVTPAESFLETASLVGSADARRLTFLPGRVLTDDVLRDGRILFEAGTRTRELYTIYPDGTGVEAVRCDHGADRGDGRQISSGDVIFSAAGRLARFTSAMATQAEVKQPAGEIAGSVAEIAPEQWMLTMRGKNGHFELYRWEAANGQLARLIGTSRLHTVEPALVAPRMAPKRFPSALVTARTAGNLLCLNARTSRSPMPAAEIRRVRVYTQSAAGAATVLGESSVETDGSFYIQVPADKPLRMELLDAAGGVIRAEHNWFWMRPSEQRICVGCHAGPERAPENKVPEILLKTTDPVKMLEAK